jgi:shikimate kinase
MTRIFLIGYMGAGKTTLGRALARKLNLSFIDTDWFIENRFHKKIHELFDERGEAGFRELEQRILHEVAEFEDVLISTGGGLPCFFDNMELMNRQGVTVFLDARPEVLFRRLRSTIVARPILMGKKDEELQAFIIQALEKRLPFYTQAQHTFKADELESRWQIDEAVRKLCETLGHDKTRNQSGPITK